MRNLHVIKVFCLVVCLIIPFQAGLAFAEPRTALVIGNGKYREAALKNPVNDARDISRALKKAGFSVTTELNADRKKMRKAIRRFGDRIKRGGIGLFYYAGHGIQVDGENYLVPIGARVSREFEVEDECLKASSVLRAMEDAGNRVNIIILDACRDNPFRGFRSRSRGLAKMDAPTGSLLAYATAPGSVASDGAGRNGLYTSCLLKYINRKGLRLLDMFMNVRRDVMNSSGGAQVPWETHSMTRPFYFTGGSAVAASTMPKSATTAPAKKQVKTSSLSTSSRPSGKDRVIYAYDFSKNWGPKIRTAGITVKVADGVFTLENKNTRYNSWSEYVKTFKEFPAKSFSATIMIKFLGGHPFGHHGIGMSDKDGNGYYFYINGNRKYKFIQAQAMPSSEIGQRSLHFSEIIEWTKSDQIYKNEYNKLTMTINDDKASLYINDSLVNTTEVKFYKYDNLKVTVGRNQTIEIDDVIVTSDR